jgi:hypothetical protein
MCPGSLTDLSQKTEVICLQIPGVELIFVLMFPPETMQSSQRISN